MALLRRLLRAAKPLIAPSPGIALLPRGFHRALTGSHTLNQSITLHTAFRLTPQTAAAVAADGSPPLVHVREMEDGLEMRWQGDDNVSFFHYEWLHRWHFCVPVAERVPVSGNCEPLRAYIAQPVDLGMWGHVVLCMHVHVCTCLFICASKCV